MACNGDGGRAYYVDNQGPEHWSSCETCDGTGLNSLRGIIKND
jgi:hypothetical protein